jgi:hypothetical protein
MDKILRFVEYLCHGTKSRGRGVCGNRVSITIFLFFKGDEISELLHINQPATITLAPVRFEKNYSHCFRDLKIKF